MPLKLGLRPHTPDPRDLHLVNYFDHRAALKGPEASSAGDSLPAAFGHGDLVAEGEWGVLGNDRVGDCVFAGAAHETLVLGREGEHKPHFDEGTVLGDYSALTGYDPADPSTDQGTDMRAAAQYRRKTGIEDSGYLTPKEPEPSRHRIGAYLWLERGDVDQFWAALHTFSVAGIGYELPESAEQQFSEGKPWDVVRGSPIAGGHYVPAIGRRSGGFIDAVSWGKRIAITPRFYQRYMTAGLVYVSASVLDDSGHTPEGLDRKQLLADLKALG